MRKEKTKRFKVVSNNIEALKNTVSSQNGELVFEVSCVYDAHYIVSSVGLYVLNERGFAMFDMYNDFMMTSKRYRSEYLSRFSQTKIDEDFKETMCCLDLYNTNYQIKLIDDETVFIEKKF